MPYVSQNQNNIRSKETSRYPYKGSSWFFFELGFGTNYLGLLKIGPLSLLASLILLASLNLLVSLFSPLFKYLLVLSYFENENTLNSQAFKQSSERKSLLKHLTLINISDIVGGPLKNWCCFTVWQFLRREVKTEKSTLANIWVLLIHCIFSLSITTISWLQNLSSHMNHNH